MRARVEVEMNIFVYVEGDRLEGTWRGRLFQLGTDQSWAACSGPYGKGAAPRGEYDLAPPKIIDPTVPENSGFVDPVGNAWFAPLTPQFKTERTSLGVHPDGNVPGTLGCIGIQEKDTKSLMTAIGRGATLYVL